MRKSTSEPCSASLVTKIPTNVTSAKNHVRLPIFFEQCNVYSSLTASAHIQAKLVGERIEELRKTLSSHNRREDATLKMIDLLEEYAAVLRENQAVEESVGSRSGNYYIATDTVPVSEWLGFENVYQVHCPRLFLNESVRDVRILDLEVAHPRLTSSSRSLCSIITARVQGEGSNTTWLHGKIARCNVFGRDSCLV